jgi:hypothetical protein
MKHKPQKNHPKTKGLLGKLLHKFKLKHPPETLIWKEVPECDGFDNFIKDLEIIGLSLGWIGFLKATLGFAIHILNQIFVNFSLFKINLPLIIGVLAELQFPGATPEWLRLVTQIVDILDWVANVVFSWPLGNKIILIESF